MRFHTHKWNDYSKEYTMVVLTTEDIKNDNYDQLYGAGFEILIMPYEYRFLSNKHLIMAKILISARNGEIIYV